ncbi:MAG: agmatinase family protein [Deltaproteobacteria bacterium]|nr:agmatinase family protein [Deltaproteobacteria bacterium]
MEAPPGDPSDEATGEGIFGLSCDPEDAGVVLLPVPWEATVSYGRGTAAAPEAIRRASGQVELYDLDTGRPYEAGIAMLDADPAIAAAGAEAAEAARAVVEATQAGTAASELAVLRARVDALGAWRDDQVARAVDRWLRRGKLVGVVGGDHSVAFGSIAAHAHCHPGLGVLQLDAHADLRAAYQGFRSSHASVMRRVADELPAVARLVQVGVRDLCETEHRLVEASGGRIVAFFAADIARRVLAAEPFGRLVDEIVAALPEQIYVSFDIDALDPALCPHTGTPVPGGLSFHQVVAVIAAVRTSGRRLVGFDLCEVGAGAEGDEWDANVGARVLYQLIGQALRSRESR